jgi:uncharacterized membrane protein YphA (DoxX/SURF4 family)
MQYGQWIGRTALALIFLFNALGIVDQTRAAHELAVHGAPAALVPTLIVAGRALQLVAGIALVIGWHERIAALLQVHDLRADVWKSDSEFEEFLADTYRSREAGLP